MSYSKEVLRWAKEVIEEAKKEFESQAVEREDKGMFPGMTRTIVNCKEGTIECVCTHREGTLYGCDYTVYVDDEDVYTNFEGEVSGSLEKVNALLKDFISVRTYPY